MVRPFAIPDLPVLTGHQASSFDAFAIRELGVPEVALMERAGAGAAALVQELASPGPVLVLAGKGNNGGDALVVGRCLRAWGREVRVLLTADRPSDDPLLHGWPLVVERTEGVGDEGLGSRLGEALSREGVIVDGILGTGIQGPPRGEAGRALGLLEEATARGASGARVVALDVPSGVDADTGRIPGASIQAHVTVSFGWPKLGTLLHPGRGRTGRLVALEIGFPPLPADFEAGRALTPAWARANRPARRLVTHKNDVGALAVVAGRPGMAGAAVLAARSALRSGAGFVRVVTHPANREIVQTALPEAVFVDSTDADAVEEALACSRALAVGPGMGTGKAAEELLERALRAHRPRVLDADALTILAASEELRKAAYGPGTVITPHPGEADRLLGPAAPGAGGDRLATLQALRAGTETIVLLKGTPSLILGQEGLWVETVGSSDLAVAGMGDTLTGAVGSFLAQGCAPQVAAGLGLVVTGRAAARAGRGAGLQAGDVPEHLPDALHEGEGETDLRTPGVILDLDPSR